MRQNRLYSRVDSAQKLEALEATDVLGFRVLARRLLERALGPRQLLPPPDSPDPAYDGELQAEIHIGASRGRLEQAERLWPDFPKLVDRSAALILRSPFVEERMRRTIREMRGTSGPARAPYIWSIADELFECVLQTHASQVRAAVARTGRIAPQTEDELALVLLDDIDVAVRSELSRVIRPPEWRPSVLSDVISAVVPLDTGPWAGWYCAGHTETELLLDETYGKVVGAVGVMGGIVFPVLGTDIRGRMPFHEAQWRVWKGGRPVGQPPAVPLGPVAGLFRTRHPLGPLELVCPHPLVLDFGLEPASRLGGLRLVDSDGELAVVGRQWRMRPVSPDYGAGGPHGLAGADLLIRGDVLAALRAVASADPVYVRKTVMADT